MSTIWALSLIDLVVLFGVAAVLPLALGGPGWRWAASAVGVLAALLLPVGTASALFVLPWVATCGAAVVDRIMASLPLRSATPAEPMMALAAGFALVASGALVFSRLGWMLFGIGEPIVELTAMHYTFAGTAALVLAVAAYRRASSTRLHRLSIVGMVCTAAAPAIVAGGFVSHLAIPQVGGAVLLTAGVWCTCTLELIAAADRRRPGLVRAGLAVSGLATWVPMVLAVAWAMGQHWSVPVLSIPDMARTHGLVNALAFVLCGLAARQAEARHIDRDVGETAVQSFESAAKS